MSFSEALALLNQRYVVRRTTWHKDFGMVLYKGELWYTVKGTLTAHCKRVDEKNILALDWVCEKSNIK